MFFLAARRSALTLPPPDITAPRGSLEQHIFFCEIVSAAEKTRTFADLDKFSLQRIELGII
jgi:hypothetical protein